MQRCSKNDREAVIGCCWTRKQRFCFWLATYLLFTFLLLLSLISVHAATLTAGDLAPQGNLDGQLTAADLVILQQFVLGTRTPVGNEELVADVAPLGATDGELNTADILILTRAIMGQVTLPDVVTGPDAPTLDPITSPTSDNPLLITGTAAANNKNRTIRSCSFNLPQDGSY